MRWLIPVFIALQTSSVFAEEPVSLAENVAATAAPPDIYAYCVSELSKIPPKFDPENINNICKAMQQHEVCESEQGRPIMHYEKVGSGSLGPGADKGKKILAISLIHGDEGPSGGVTRSWIHRLMQIDARNTWRVLPLANPDGFIKRTRYNANGVDINRNFPSLDWPKNAMDYWVKNAKKDRRRYPGAKAASEKETKCLIAHIEEFKPDFIISVHTPLGVLDFDGPRVGNPNFKPLPWVGLGNFSGSLGRYMWMDHKVPVLTIELKGNSGVRKLEDFDRLQDISGTVAIQSAKMLKARVADSQGE